MTYTKLQPKPFAKADTSYYESKFNLTREEVVTYHGQYGSHWKYTKNRVDRAGVKIEFKLTFEQWLQIWLDSGFLHLRGPGHGHYCMSRFNDLGHYEVGNVEIKPTVDNNREGQVGRKKPPRTAEHIAKLKQNLEKARAKRNNK